MESPLKDLDVNVAFRCGDTDVKSIVREEPPMTRVMEALECGKIWYNQQGLDRRYVSLEIDWFEFRAIEWNQCLIAVFNTHKGTVAAKCRMEQEVIEALSKCRWVTLHLNQMVCKDELSFQSEFRLCGDFKSISIAKPQFEPLYRDLMNHLDLFEHQGTQLMPPSPLRDPGLSACILASHSAPSIETQEVSMTPREVTYLIGTAGTRIETTRDHSQATIKVLPLPHRTRSKTQTLAITGTTHQVAAALALLEAQLTIHKLQPNRLF